MTRKGSQQPDEGQLPTSTVAPTVAVSAEVGLPIEELRRMALQTPRDEARALKLAIDELTACPEVAERHYYSIPYKDNKTGETVHVEGLSVTAAKSLGRRWGNCVFLGGFVSLEDDRAVCRGACVDLENLYLASAQKIAHRVARYGGRLVQLREDKWAQKLDSTISKCVRNAILDVIPMGAKVAYFNTARRLAAGGTGDPEKDAARLAAGLDKLAAACEKRGITSEQVEAVIGKKLEEWTLDDLGRMHGVLNAIAQGERTREEVFGGTDEGGADKVASATQKLFGVDADGGEAGDGE